MRAGQPVIYLVMGLPPNLIAIASQLEAQRPMRFALCSVLPAFHFPLFTASAMRIPARMHPAPIHPQGPILSPIQNQAKKAAKTGSMERMIAVRVGEVRAWAQV